MIIDLLELPNHKICAIDQNGVLYLWPNYQANCKQIQPSNMHWPITHYLPLSLNLINQKYLIISTTKQIIMTTLQSLQTYSERYQHKQNQYMRHAADSNHKNHEKQEIILQRVNVENISDQINSIEVICNKNMIQHLSASTSSISQMEQENQQQNVCDEKFAIVYGTKLGTLYCCVVQKRVNFQICEREGKKSIVLANFGLQSNGVGTMQEEIKENFGSKQIKGILSFRDDSLLLVGTEEPKLYLLNVVNRQIIQQLFSNLNCNNTLLPLRQLYCNRRYNKQKFYTIHTSYFIEWNFELLQSEGFYKLKNLKEICVTEETNPSIISTNGQKLLSDSLPISKENFACIIQTSLENIRKMKGLRNGQLAIGGNDGMIEIFYGGVKDKLLFTQY